MRSKVLAPIVRPVLRPMMRFIVGLLAIPLFRMFLKKVIRLQEIDEELEKDLEQWFRGSLLLLAATANMENFLFGWVPLDLEGADAWVGIFFRLLLAISVIEAMPDQELFAIIHPGPPKLNLSRENGIWRELRLNIRPICKGVVCQHLNRSSPVLAIMAAIFSGPTGSPGWIVGWVCYGMAIAQYLIIGLVTSRDKALDVLSEFDRQVAIRRRELVEEFDVPDQTKPKSTKPKQKKAARKKKTQEPPPQQPATDPQSGSIA